MFNRGGKCTGRNQVGDLVAPRFFSCVACWVIFCSVPGEARLPLRQEQSPRQVREELRELQSELRGRYPDQRQRAIKKLARLDTWEAWELVLRGLADQAPEVADEARVQLALCTREDVRKALAGDAGLSHKDERVRWRSAEVFGRSAAPFPWKEIVRAFDAREVEFARTLALAVQWRATEATSAEAETTARELEPLLRPGLEPRLRSAALYALTAVQPKQASAAVERALRDDQAEVRCSALDCALRLQTVDPKNRLSAMADDPAASVRMLTLEGLERWPSKAGLLVLADRLEHETRPALRWRALAALQRLTGRKDRLDPRPWRAFVGSLSDEWQPTALAAATEVGNRTVALAGMSIVSDHIAFLIDFSGSLWRTDESGRSRKTIVDEKMREALQALPESTRFNVIPYTHIPHPWAEGLVVASPARKEQAVHDFVACQERGKGNFYDAAMLALRDPLVDTVLVLTDGVPTGGQRFQLDLLLEALLAENRTRRVIFDAILVDTPPGIQRKWAHFCQATGGRALAVELK